jgi:hypothetical protein
MNLKQKNKTRIRIYTKTLDMKVDTKKTILLNQKFIPIYWILKTEIKKSDNINHYFKFKKISYKFRLELIYSDKIRITLDFPHYSIEIKSENIIPLYFFIKKYPYLFKKYNLLK